MGLCISKCVCYPCVLSCPTTQPFPAWLEEAVARLDGWQTPTKWTLQLRNADSTPELLTWIDNRPHSSTTRELIPCIGELNSNRLLPELWNIVVAYTDLQTVTCYAQSDPNRTPITVLFSLPYAVFCWSSTQGHKQISFFHEIPDSNSHKKSTAVCFFPANQLSVSLFPSKPPVSQSLCGSFLSK